MIKNLINKSFTKSTDTSDSDIINIKMTRDTFNKLSKKYKFEQTDINLILSQTNKYDDLLKQLDKYGISKLSEMIADEKQNEIFEVASEVFQLKTTEPYHKVLVEIFGIVNNLSDVNAHVVDTLYAETENYLSILGEDLDVLYQIHNG